MKKIILSTLTIATLAMATETISVDSGWQLLGTSNPVANMEDFNIAPVDTVWTYDKITASWKVFSTSDSVNTVIEDSTTLSKLTDIAPNQGFWLNANSAGTVELNKPEDTTTPLVNIRDEKCSSTQCLGYNESDRSVYIRANTTDSTWNHLFTIVDETADIRDDYYWNFNVDFLSNGNFLVSKEYYMDNYDQTTFVSLVDNSSSSVNVTTSQYETYSSRGEIFTSADKLEKILILNSYKNSDVKILKYDIANNKFSEVVYPGELTTFGWSSNFDDVTGTTIYSLQDILLGSQYNKETIILDGDINVLVTLDKYFNRTDRYNDKIFLSTYSWTGIQDENLYSLEEDFSLKTYTLGGTVRGLASTYIDSKRTLYAATHIKSGDDINIYKYNEASDNWETGDTIDSYNGQINYFNNRYVDGESRLEIGTDYYSPDYISDVNGTNWTVNSDRTTARILTNSSEESTDKTITVQTGKNSFKVIKTQF